MSDSTIFRFEVFCTSKQLGGALEALTGKVAQVAPPQMVANAAAKSNGAVRMSGADLNELFLAWLKKKKLTEFRPPDARAFLQEHGRSDNSYSYLLTKMKAAGLIKSLGDSPATARWIVVGAKTKTKRGLPAKKQPVRPRRESTPAAAAAKAE